MNTAHTFTDADEIEALRKTNSDLLFALQLIAKPEASDTLEMLRGTARAALAAIEGKS